MEFWGLEVKPGQAVKCKPEDDHFLHLSQGALGESKKDTDKATMYVKVDDKKLSIGTLSADRFPQIQFDLVFEKEFELSHTSKTASVFFSGYKVFQPAEGDEMDFDSEGSEEEEEVVIPVTKENGKTEGKDKEQKSPVKIDAAASKPKAVAKDVGKNKDDVNSDDTESDDSDEGLTPIEDALDRRIQEEVRRQLAVFKEALKAEFGLSNIDLASPENIRSSSASVEESVGETYPCDTISEPTPCILLTRVARVAGDVFLDVAFGIAYPNEVEAILHGRLITSNYQKVHVDDVVESFKELPLAVPPNDEITVLHQTVGTFIQWPKRDIKLVVRPAS